MNKRVVCVHNGALGDFLNCWPALAGLAQQNGPERVAWAGKNVYGHWVYPLGMVPASPEERRAVEQLYVADRWPEALADCTVVWFGLERSPSANASVLQDERFLFVRGIAPDRFVPPRELALETLEAAGAPRCDSWAELWKALFGGWRGADSCIIRLFPGAGHVAKQWPLVKFFELAGRLESVGWRPRFVLGPAEMERGMRIDRYPVDVPEDFPQLERLLQRTRAVCTNDCGPMHLAGMVGTPGVALFGPTSADQWGPPGLLHVRSPAACSPCTRTTAAIPCREPACMQEISVDQVGKALAEALRSEG